MTAHEIIKRLMCCIESLIAELEQVKRERDVWKQRAEEACVDELHIYEDGTGISWCVGECTRQWTCENDGGADDAR